MGVEITDAMVDAAEARYLKPFGKPVTAREVVRQMLSAALTVVPANDAAYDADAPSGSPVGPGPEDERAEHPDKAFLSRLPEGWAEVPDGLHDYVPVQAWNTSAGWALICEGHLAREMYYEHGVEFRAEPELIERAQQIRSAPAASPVERTEGDETALRPSHVEVRNLVRGVHERAWDGEDDAELYSLLARAVIARFFPSPVGGSSESEYRGPSEEWRASEGEVDDAEPPCSECGWRGWLRVDDPAGHQLRTACDVCAPAAPVEGGAQ